MLHNLTIGHLETTSVGERGIRVFKPLDVHIVERHLSDLGERAGADWLLGGSRVEFRNDCVIVPWMGGRINRLAEEFALRMARDTGCQVIDREQGRLDDVQQLVGVPDASGLPPGRRGEHALRGT